MPRAKLTFRQRDVTAAVKAVEAAGHVVERVEIAPDGRIVVIATKLATDANAQTNEWDEVLDEDPAALRP
jgi:hypothetical protein